MQAHTWILVADGARARLFETDPQDTEHLHEIQDFANSAAEARANELETDNLGRFYGKGERNQAHTAEPHEDPVQHATRKFTHDLGSFLDHACEQHRYEKLFVVAPPKMLGALRQSMKDETRQSVDREIAKDISWLNERDIEAYVKGALSLH
ncbi:MAG: host attachment protein [Paucimonas sp.]|jgi:protein required for attachment to host cells|nr:host attachment protein [Paucimonas sp.]